MPTETVLIVEDDILLNRSVQEKLSGEGYKVLSAGTGEEALERIGEELPDLMLLDIMLPGIDGVEVLKRMRDLTKEVVVIVLTASEVVQTAVEAMKLGAYDYISKPFDVDGVLITIENALESTRLKREVALIRSQQRQLYGFGNIIGTSPPMQEVYERISKVIEMDVKTVLILGETGTGKDLAARTIHYQSSRHGHSFVEVNCMNISDNILESELFGHERGAFTDAKELKRGLFEHAQGGTVLLDEIGHMPHHLQGKLLRVIEERKFRRVGGVKDFDADVLLIAATNRDLWKAVENGDFREDLFYRIKLVPIYMPSLRERKEDLPLLIKYLLQTANREFKRNVQGISGEAEELLAQYDWPGNVRELKNVIERAVILGDEDQILVKHLPREIAKNGTDAALTFRLPERGLSLAQVEKEFIDQALKIAKGNQVQAARLLGITRHALRHRMKKYDIRLSELKRP
ncbi:MAG: response regulator [Proteobacteria bacterium]|nr:response regulator [Pseudomonadota bacterium]NIS69865.1 response regulator [Pseudomonadota bacterium]